LEKVSTGIEFEATVKHFKSKTFYKPGIAVIHPRGTIILGLDLDNTGNNKRDSNKFIILPV